MSIRKLTGLIFLVLALASLVAYFTVSGAHDLLHFCTVLFAILGFTILFHPKIGRWAKYAKSNPVSIVQKVFFAWGAISIIYQVLVYLGKLLFPQDLVNWISSHAAWVDNLQFILDVQVAIFLVLTSLLASTYMAMMHMRDLPANVRAVEDAAEKVSNYGINNAGQALNIVGRLLGLKEFSEARKKDHHDSSTDALAAIACNLGNWESHIRSHSSPGRQSSILTEVWLRSQSAYFLEEGYEIGKKSMATNGRNFCFLLLATLDAFLKRSNSDETVCYTAVTPVSPEDWYNWPHGYGTDKKHFENEFVGDFQRVLREYLSQNISAKLEHSRYLLIAKDKPHNGSGNPKQFGWELSTEAHFKLDVEGWIVPVSIKLEALSSSVMSSKDPHYKYGTKLHSYFTDIRKVEETIENNKPVYVTPTFSKRWDNAIGSDIGTAPSPEVVKAFIDMASKDHLRSATNIKEGLRAGSRQRLENGKFNQEVEEMLERSLDTVKNFEGDYQKAGVDGSFLKWLQDSHSVEANLAEVSSDCAQKFHRLRYHLLRLRDGYHYFRRAEELGNELSVGNVFATFLHSKPEGCIVKTLNQDELEDLKENKVQPEFHLFGTRKTTPEVDSDGKPDWQLLVTTLLDYPFEVTRITLNDEPNNAIFKKHVDFLNKLSLNRGTGDNTYQSSKPLISYISENE